MTILKKKIMRETHASVFEQGKRRAVIVSFEPPSLIGFRLKGTRKTYFLDVGAFYIRAVKTEVERRTQERKKKRKK